METYETTRPVRPIYTPKFTQERPYITYILLVLVVMVQIYVMTLNDVQLINFYYRYANDAALVREGEYYRLFTSMFLHSTELAHILFNGIALLSLGRELEGPVGHLRFLLIYLMGGWMGSLASVVVTQGRSVGASGAVFAIFGAVMVYLYLHRKLYGENALKQLRYLGVLALLNLGMGLLTTIPGAGVRIDNAAHVGGFIGGVVLAFFIIPLYTRRMEYDLETGTLRENIINIRSQWQWMIAVMLFGLGLVVATWLVANP